MNRQSSLEKYFKSCKMNASASPGLPHSSELIGGKGKQFRKRTLSLAKPVTPSKSPKECPERDKSNVKDLSSDEERSITTGVTPIKIQKILVGDRMANSSTTSETFDDHISSTTSDLRLSNGKRNNQLIVNSESHVSKKKYDLNLMKSSSLEEVAKSDRIVDVIDLCSDDEDLPICVTPITNSFVIDVNAVTSSSPKISSNNHSTTSAAVNDDVQILELDKLITSTHSASNVQSTSKSTCTQNSNASIQNIDDIESFDDVTFNSDDDIPMPSTPPRATPTSSKTDQHFSNVPPNDDCGEDSDLSQTTIIYTVPHTTTPPPAQTPQRTPQTPQRTPQTPQRTPQTPSGSFRSPNSAQKYFSPVKKRAVSKKGNVKRKLTQSLGGSEDDEVLKNACSGLDNKTIFLLTIISKCIKNPLLLQLLDEMSQNLLCKCMLVAKPGMRLVCRLYWYKDIWYKKKKINLLLRGEDTEIENMLENAIDSLVENGLLTFAGPNENAMNFDDYTDILNADELKQICKDLKLNIKSKQTAVTALKEYCKTKSIASFFKTPTKNNTTSHSRCLNLMKEKAGPCYKLSDLARKTIHNLYILMYLGIDYDLIRENKLELTLMYDKISRETYPVSDNMLDNASVVFRERNQFQRYLKAHNDYEEYLNVDDHNKKCDIITRAFEELKNIPENELLWCEALSSWLRRFTPMHLYVKMLESGIQELKKAKRSELALEILDALISQNICRQHKKALWYAEKALVLNQEGRPEQAAKVLLEGFRSNIDDELKDVMRPRAKIIANKKGLDLDEDMLNELLKYATKEDILEKNLRSTHVYKQPMDRTEQRGKIKFKTITPSGELLVQDVEDFCLSHYINSGEFTAGLHCEGRLVTTIFFLLFWDIIYYRPADCAGVFLTRFQKYPLDLFDEGFYANRRQLIEERLEFIEKCTADELVEIMSAKWQERPESELSGLCRDGVGWQQAQAAARCAGAGLAALSRRLAARPARARAGFPDLALWNTATGRIKFVEVKSDTDRPSMKQLQWMHFLQRNGFDAEFCYVGVNTTRIKSLATDLSELMFPVYIPLLAMSAVSALSVLYLYCKNRGNSRKGYMDVSQKPSTTE